MTKSTKGLVLIGEVRKPHGIKGEVSVTSHADSPFLLQKSATVFLRPGKRAQKTPPPAKGGKKGPRKPSRPVKPKKFTIASSRPHKDAVLLIFKEVPDRNAAEALRGYEILVHEDQLPPTNEGEIYAHQIEGLTAVTVDNVELGPIREVQFPAGQEIWVIDTPAGEVLFPVAEQFVDGFDLEAGEVFIDPPEGLIDLYIGNDDAEATPSDKD